MDIAYDHVQEGVLSPADEAAQTNSTSPSSDSINAELSQAFKAVSTSEWGVRLGGWFSQARTRTESFYNDLQKEASEAQEQASRGFASLRDQVIQRTGGISLDAEPGPEAIVPGEEAVPSQKTTASTNDSIATSDSVTSAAAEEHTPTASLVAEGRPESLPADIVREATGLVASLRTTAAARLKDLQAAEDAADEALLRFGANVRNFLRDAVTITGPTPDESASSSNASTSNRNGDSNQVLFETSEPSGRKVFHRNRLDAQLHAIHVNPTSFTTDASSTEGDSEVDDDGQKMWTAWYQEFDVDAHTTAIAQDLDKYTDLRRAMEQLVPEKVDYASFWRRYYFLRKAVEEEERRRKQILQGASVEADEEIGWGDDDDDDDDDDDEDRTSTPHPGGQLTNDSTTTLSAADKTGATSTATPTKPSSSDLLKPSRPSHEDDKSVAGSDASYDLVSGATTRAAGSPKEEVSEGRKGKAKDTKAEDDSDDDWE